VFFNNSKLEPMLSYPSLPENVRVRAFEIFKESIAPATDGTPVLKTSTGLSVKTSVVSSSGSEENISYSPKSNSPSPIDTPMTAFSSNETDETSPLPEVNEHEIDINDVQAESFLAIRKIVLGCDFTSSKPKSQPVEEDSMLSSEFYSSDNKVLVSYLCRNGSSVLNEMSAPLVVERARKDFKQIAGILSHVDIVRRIIELDEAFAAMLLRYCFNSSRISKQHDIDIYKNLCYSEPEALHHLHIWQTLFPCSFYNRLPRIIESLNDFCDLQGNWPFIHRITLDARSEDLSRLENWILTRDFESCSTHLIGFETKTVEKFMANMFPMIVSDTSSNASPSTSNRAGSPMSDWQICRVLNLWIVECERDGQQRAKFFYDFCNDNFSIVKGTFLPDCCRKGFFNTRISLDVDSLPVSLFNFLTRLKNLTSGASKIIDNGNSDSSVDREDATAVAPNSKKRRLSQPAPKTKNGSSVARSSKIVVLSDSGSSDEEQLVIQDDFQSDDAGYHQSKENSQSNSAVNFDAFTKDFVMDDDDIINDGEDDSEIVILIDGEDDAADRRFDMGGMAMRRVRDIKSSTSKHNNK
jgi:hypothetical protein